MTTTIKSIWDRNYNAGLGVVVIRSICIGDGENVVDIYNGTKIYEQDGTSGSKKQMGIEAIDVLQPGQVVNITFTRFKDDEFHDLLYQKFPHGFGVYHWQGVSEITINKGQYRSIPPDQNIDLCEAYSSSSASETCCIP